MEGATHPAVLPAGHDVGQAQLSAGCPVVFPSYPYACLYLVPCVLPSAAVVPAAVVSREQHAPVLGPGVYGFAAQALLLQQLHNHNQPLSGGQAQQRGRRARGRPARRQGCGCFAAGMLLPRGC
jgi:hypothetical protein